MTRRWFLKKLAAVAVVASVQVEALLSVAPPEPEEWVSTGFAAQLMDLHDLESGALAAVCRSMAYREERAILGEYGAILGGGA